MTARRAGVHLYTPQDAYRLSAGGRSDEPGNAGTNPFPGATVFYSLGDEPDEATEVGLEVFRDGDDEAIWHWTRKPPPSDDDEEASGPNDPPDTRVLSADAGLNRFVWDLRYPGMSRFEDLIMWADMRAGPLAVPGRYRARADRWRRSAGKFVHRAPRPAHRRRPRPTTPRSSTSLWKRATC